MIALCCVDAIFSLFELYDVSSRVSHCSIILYSQMFHCVDESSLHVTALLCSYRSVYKTFSSTHCMEEELYRVQAISVGCVYESSRFSFCISGFKEG